jgi:hypothetical protein
MIDGVSNSSLIAAAFGPGAARRVRGATAPVAPPDARGVQPIGQIVYPQPLDRVELSHHLHRTDPLQDVARPAEEPRIDPSRPPGTVQEPVSAGPVNALDEASLSEEDRGKVGELKERDAEVRRHEQAHIAAGGQYVQGGAQYTYETGPDGKQYATGGEVAIDTSPVPGDPAATIRKMQVIRRAALAPSDPSQADRRIAAEAQQHEMKARVELQAQRAQRRESTSDPTAHNVYRPEIGGHGASQEISETAAAQGAGPIGDGPPAARSENGTRPVWMNRPAHYTNGRPAPVPLAEPSPTSVGSSVAARSYAGLTLAGRRVSMLA